MKMYSNDFCLPVNKSALPIHGPKLAFDISSKRSKIYFLMHLYEKNIDKCIFREPLKADVLYLAQIFY